MLTTTHGVIAGLAVLLCQPEPYKLSSRRITMLHISCVVGSTFADYALLYNMGVNFLNHEPMENRLFWVEPTLGILHSIVVTLLVWVIIDPRIKKKSTRVVICAFFLGSMLHIIGDATTHGVWPERPLHSYTWPFKFPLSWLLGIWNYHPKGLTPMPTTTEILINCWAITAWAGLMLQYTIRRFGYKICLAFKFLLVLFQRISKTKYEMVSHHCGFSFSLAHVQARGPPR